MSASAGLTAVGQGTLEIQSEGRKCQHNGIQVMRDLRVWSSGKGSGLEIQVWEWPARRRCFKSRDVRQTRARETEKEEPAGQTDSEECPVHEVKRGNVSRRRWPSTVHEMCSVGQGPRTDRLEKGGHLRR